MFFFSKKLLISHISLPTRSDLEGSQGAVHQRHSGKIDNKFNHLTDRRLSCSSSPQQVEDWKQIWVPDVVKEAVPGEKYLGKDEHGNEYTAHDVWKKKMIWKPQWKKIWKTKQVEDFKIEKVQDFKIEKVQDWKIEKKQDWVS